MDEVIEIGWIGLKLVGLIIVVVILAKMGGL